MTFENQLALAQTVQGKAKQDGERTAAECCRWQSANDAARDHIQ